MRKGGHGYHTLLSRLNARYDYELEDCYENPKILRILLQEVYGKEYESIIDELEVELTEYLDRTEVQNFLHALKDEN